MVDKPSHNGQREFVETALPRVFRMVEQAEYGAADNSNEPGGHRSRSEKQIVRIHIRIRKKRTVRRSVAMPHPVWERKVRATESTVQVNGLEAAMFRHWYRDESPQGG